MISFTICSNNYLAEAITLGDSLVTQGTAPENFIILLVDKEHESIDYKKIMFEVIPITEDVVEGFNNICSYYDIVELNTSIKPSAFKYLITKYPSESLFAYLDPDLYFLQNIETSIQQEIGSSSVLLTPHLLKPVSLNQEPFENVFLNYGIYNLGFIALKPDKNSLALLNWWEERTLKMGVSNVKEGFFVDQLWLNLATVFFQQIKVSLNPGLNTAYWNLNERKVEKTNNVLFVNDTFPLIFFHFSSFDLSLKKISKRGYSTPTWDMSDINELMKVYKTNLELNNYSFYRNISSSYVVTFKNYLEKKLPAGTDRQKILIIDKFIKYIPNFFIQSFLNLAYIVSILKEKKL